MLPVIGCGSRSAGSRLQKCPRTVLGLRFCKLYVTIQQRMQYFSSDRLSVRLTARRCTGKKFQEYLTKPVRHTALQYDRCPLLVYTGCEINFNILLLETVARESKRKCCKHQKREALSCNTEQLNHILQTYTQNHTTHTTPDR